MDDPYKALGVNRDATQDQIKSAYRKLARTLHPDVNPGNKQAEERFKRVSGAYDLLSDPAKRARFDAGEIDAMGSERPRANPNWNTGAGAGRPDAHFAFGEDANDILSELFRRRANGRRAGFGGFGFGGGDAGEEAARGADSQYVLRVTLPESALGTTKRVTLSSGKTLDVKVPPGTEDGAVLRLKGQGNPGMGGGPAGDALVEVKTEAHAIFKRDGNDVTMDLPVTLAEAALGGKVTVPTLDGRVALNIPAGSNSGAVLRLKGKGFPKGRSRGDQLVTLRVMLPDTIDSDLESFLKKWSSAHPYDVRSKLDNAS
ncbi:MAG TPA: J domain-containing protein [Magnetospirillaceae bacterium]